MFARAYPDVEELPVSSLFAHRDYRRLFGAQLVALFGTGLTTVALGLLAYELAGPTAGAVLGTALALKMVTYVTVAPIAAAYADRVPRRSMLVTLDVVRAGVVLALPFVDQVWQIYVLIVVLQSASASFTPTFQAVLPDILPDERDYTKALSASQLASTMESLLSPALALPRFLDRIPERPVMLAGAGTLAAGFAGAIALSTVDSGGWRWPAALAVWAVIGAGTGFTLTPVGRVLRRSSRATDRAAVFAAQFSLSHACWLLAYPIAGWVATEAGFTWTWLILAVPTAVGIVVALRFWPRRDPVVLEHTHPIGQVDPDHVADAVDERGRHRHAHEFVIDRDHRRWPALSGRR
jgi:MFS family permease